MPESTVSGKQLPIRETVVVVVVVVVVAATKFKSL